MTSESTCSIMTPCFLETHLLETSSERKGSVKEREIQKWGKKVEEERKAAI